jgi:hypothetical protein
MGARLFNDNHWPQLAKLFVADAAHHHEVLGAAKRAKLLAMRNDSFRDTATYARKGFECFRGSGIDVDLLPAITR